MATAIKRATKNGNRNGRAPKPKANTATAAPEIADHFYLLTDGNDDTCGTVYGIRRPADAAAKSIVNPPVVVKRIDFVPAATKDRFVVVGMKWCHAEPPEPDEEDLRPFSRGHRWLIDRMEEEGLDRPPSLVAVPPFLMADRGEWCFQGLFQTREQALADTAEHNAELDYWDWWAIAEIGAPITDSVCTFEITESGIGVVDSSVQYPVRLVLPAAEELARFPVPDDANPAHGKEWAKAMSRAIEDIG